MEKANKSLIKDFELTIQEHENQLFGISLFYEAVKLLYKHDKNTLETTENHFQEIMARGINTIQKAKTILEKAKNGIIESSQLACFEFLPIHGYGLDEMTERASILVQTYEKLFPNRPHVLKLTDEELELVVTESAKNWQ